jgi:Spy/CpxP family protein refolding chaperone
MIPEAIRGQDALEARGRWWQTSRVQQELRLTPAQIEKLGALFEDGFSERLALRRKIEEMDRLLERTLERGNADDASVARLSEQVEALRAQANVRSTLMLFAMYRTLTREQRAAFTELRQAATRSASPPRPESPPRRD